MLYTLYGFAIFFLIFWSSLWLVHIMAVIYGKWRLHRKQEPPDAEKEVVGVSIIKPLCGGDTNLFKNLETFFNLKYAKYEVLFCVQDPDDTVCVMYVKSLKVKYPNVDCSLFTGGERVGLNPKINNMQPAYRAAKHPFILVSDSGIRMEEDTLTDMVSAMTEKVGLVHQMPFACDRTGLPATLEKVYFGTSHARIYLSANLLGINCATGMSALMRKELLDNAGGFKHFGCYLAEDFFFAKSIMDQGYQVVISPQPAWQNSGNCSVSLFQNRITRWTKLRAAMCPHTLLLEPFSECLTIGALAAWACYFLFRTDPFFFYLTHILIWFIADYTLLRIIQNGKLPFNKLEFLVMWLFREAAAPYLFLHAMWNPTIRWRNKEFRLKWGGVAEPIPQSTRITKSSGGLMAKGNCLLSTLGDFPFFTKLPFLKMSFPTFRVINHHIFPTRRRPFTASKG